MTSSTGEQHPSLTYNEQGHELLIDEFYQPSPFQRSRITDEAFFHHLATSRLPNQLPPQLTVKWVDETYSDWLAGVCSQLDALQQQLQLRSLHLHPTFVHLPFHHLLRRISHCQEVTLFLDITLITSEQSVHNAQLVCQHLATGSVNHLNLLYSNCTSALPTIPNTLLQSLFNSTTTLRSVELPQSLLTSTSVNVLIDALNTCSSLSHLTITGSNTLCSPSHDRHSAVLYINLLQLLNSSISQRLLSLKLHICTGDEHEVVDGVCTSICQMPNLQKLHVTTSRRFNQLRPSPPTVPEPLSVRLLRVGSEHRSGTLQDITVEFDNVSLDNDIRVFGGPQVKQQIFDEVNSWQNVFYARIQTPLLTAYDTTRLSYVLLRNRHSHRVTIDAILEKYSIHEWSIRDQVFEYLFLTVTNELRYGGGQPELDQWTNVLPPLTPTPPTQPMISSEMMLTEQNIDVY